MTNFKRGSSVCTLCTRRRCKLRPTKDNTCTKFAAAKMGWRMEEVMHDKLSQT